MKSCENKIRKRFKRYIRHLIIPEIGIEGLEKFKNSSVCVVGAGGIGGPVISYLAASGVGKIIIVEKDKLELSNLNRQIIYKSKDIGKEKALLAKSFVNSLNSDVKVEIYSDYANYDSLLRITKKADLIIDCSDNFETRFNINRACIVNKKNYIYAAVYRFEGQIAFFEPYKGSCLGCVFKEIPLEDGNCCDYGILGPVTGIIGSMAAIEALKFLIGLPILKNKMCVMDFKDWNINIINLKKRNSCIYCSGERKWVESNSAVESVKVGRKKIIVNLSDEFFNLKDILNLKLSDVKNYFFTYPRETEIMLFCKKGIRAKIASDVLKSIGFKKVKIIDKL